MTQATMQARSPKHIGAVLHGAALYDVQVWLATFGRERKLREAMLRPACLVAGESVLDVGCGTGSLAILARRQVGSQGFVCGLDASPEMIARARKKARAAGLDVDFAEAKAQALPFPAARFDVVLSSLMLHHLGRDARRQFAAEFVRVLKPGGRVFAVDFAQPASGRKQRFPRFHRHGHFGPDDVNALLCDAGMQIQASGPIEPRIIGAVRNMHYVLALATANSRHAPVGTPET